MAPVSEITRYHVTFGCRGFPAQREGKKSETGLGLRLAGWASWVTRLSWRLCSLTPNFDARWRIVSSCLWQSLTWWLDFLFYRSPAPMRSALTIIIIIVRLQRISFFGQKTDEMTKTNGREKILIFDENWRNLPNLHFLTNGKISGSQQPRNCFGRIL